MAKIVIFSPFFFCVSHRCVCVLALLHVGEGGGGNIISCLLDGKIYGRVGWVWKGNKRPLTPRHQQFFHKKWSRRRKNCTVLHQKFLGAFPPFLCGQVTGCLCRIVEGKKSGERIKVYGKQQVGRVGGLGGL